ncbi:hypothetical protein ABC639_00010 [Lacticaseibacillus paracasei]|uniref:hypothetical protein n=1 Tax=Lacticaseibacillus paracasei TaxID=1597 RepID=UPI0031E04589
MKISIKKVPALYDLLYGAFALVMLVAAIMATLPNGFSLTGVGSTLMQWANHLWWLTLPGIVLHLLSYFASQNQRLLLIGNLIGLCAFIAFILIPNYSVFAVIGLAVAIFLILSGAKRSRRVHNNSEVS